ncbi:EamA family transporter [Cellulomonas cellasea]|uniref:EamA family transporter n=1 Tax=Cellulomonas cellasea TaxID=43670 RepID=UPI0025A445A8|nr:EamA family transporter [Cellulomonas cellasea]MDM8083849.1 EamA family transporter [Cellulomonas cellasea]
MAAEGVDARVALTRSGDFALVALGAVLWGAGGLAGAELGAVAGMSATAVAACRLLSGGLLLLGIVAVSGRLDQVPRTRAAAGRVAATAALAALYQACFFGAVASAGVATATLVALGSAPVMVAAGVALRSRRAPSGQVLAALLLALGGLGLLVGAPASGDAGGAGVLLALGSGAGFAAMTQLNTRPVPGLGALPLVGLAFVCGGLLLTAAVLVVGAGPLLPRESGGWALVLFLGAVPTAAAYAAYFRGLRTVPGTTAALLALLEPLAATVGAVLLRDERLGVAGVLGALLLLLAVVVLRPRP